MSEWIIPCNVKMFDIIRHFQSTDYIAFKRIGALRKNDIAYIYLSSPYSEIGFCCTVINEQMTPEEVNEHAYVIDKFSSRKYVLLKLEHKYKHGSLPLRELKEHGLGQVQRQARAGKELIQYIELSGIIDSVKED